MTEDETQNNRRLALASWLKANGGARSACKRNGLGKSVESHISQIIRGYSFGARAARNLEDKLGIPHRMLDSFAAEPPGLGGSSNTQLDRLDDLVIHAAQGIDQSFEGLNPSEIVYVALAANRVDKLSKLKFTIPEALARIGENWIRELTLRWQNKGNPSLIRPDIAVVHSLKTGTTA